MTYEHRKLFLSIILVGYYDNDGHFYIVDRLKELIKVKGFQVAPAELEGVLLTHPQVADCAVVGMPDERSGEVPKAFVVRKSPDVSEKDLDRFVSSKVSAHKHLKGGVGVCGLYTKISFWKDPQKTVEGLTLL